MLYLRKHFDTTGKSAALFHHRAISKTAIGRDGITNYGDSALI